MLMSSNRLEQTAQVSIKKLAMRLVEKMAWKCLKTWKEHPMTADRVVEHLGSQLTRQTKRDFPPQQVSESIISRMIEVWENIPMHVKSTEEEHTFNKRIKCWTSQLSLV